MIDCAIALNWASPVLCMYVFPFDQQISRAFHFFSLLRRIVNIHRRSTNINHGALNEGLGTEQVEVQTQAQTTIEETNAFFMRKCQK